MAKKQTEFALTTDHIKLLQASWVIWNEDDGQAAAIDPKKPCGDSGIEENVYEVLTGKYPEDGLTEKWVKHARKVHRETATALQIILKTGSFVPGKYKLKDEYDTTSWELVNEG